jgi:hypothetical protein
VGSTARTFKPASDPGHDPGVFHGKRSNGDLAE